MQFLLSLQESALSVWISESDWAYPFILTCHAIGMGAIVGFVIVVNLRALGLWRSVSLEAVGTFVPVAALGFVLNFVSGVLLFIPVGPDMILNPAFLIKIGCILGGGVVLWMLMRSIELNAGREVVDARGKAIAVGCLLFWLSAITAGRLIGYVTI